MSLTHDYAKIYASRGWHVLPLDGKIPLTQHGLKDATTDLPTIESWWGDSGKFPFANIGIRTGSESGLVVVDIDAKSGGLQSYEAMKDKFPVTPTTKTGGGGKHLVYKHTGTKVSNSASKIAPGIDIRGDNGYIVAPPSVHASGKDYEWEILPSETPLADFPIDLLPKEKTFDSKGLFTEGKRNDTTIQLVGTLQRMGIPKESVDAAVLALNNGQTVEEKMNTTERYNAWSKPLPARTELDQAEFVANYFSDQIAYDYNRGSWLVWDEHRWERTDSVFSYVVEAARVIKQKIEDEIATTGKPDAEGQKWATRLLSHSSIVNITDLLREILRKDTELDQDPYLLGVSNGVVNLATGSLLPGAPDQWITRSSPYNFNPTALAARWERFINEVFYDPDLMKDDPDLVDWVWRVLGYAVTGDTSKQCWFIYLGPGANGKSTLLRTVAEVLGDYAMSASTKTFLTDSRRQATNDLAELLGKRFVYANEAGANTPLDSERIKGITHGDKIRARHLYGHEFEFTPVLKLNVGNNLRPKVTDQSEGFWRSAYAVPMDNVFAIDPKLRQDLEAEREGILTWLVRGAQEYLQRGIYPIPARVRVKSEDWRKDNDPFDEWFRECITVGAKTLKAYGGDLWESYNKWCIKENIPEKSRIGRKSFGEYIYSVKAWRRRHDAKGNYYEGVEIKNVIP